MFESEEIEGQVKRTVDSINDFNESPSYDTAINADYQISMMKLMLGNKFDDLHWFVSSERAVVNFLEQKSNIDKIKQQMVNEVEQAVDIIGESNALG